MAECIQTENNGNKFNFNENGNSNGNNIGNRNGDDMMNSRNPFNEKLLVVGAGGIGCELLKNLVLTGFDQIEIIDLDTIELSNLNRQFLFQKVHVGKPKALIARESVLKYNKNANIIAHHDSIMSAKYNVEYFKQFSIVLNALDNKAARSHVNRLCLAADKPLIESGSAGYLGQVTLIKKGLTECYDCLPKPPAKTFPGCTIRNTPSEPIHCIVWAKHLFNQLFGAEDPDEAVSPDGEDPENMASAGQTAADKSENEEAVTRISTREWAKETNYDAVKLFNKLFNDDIKYLLSMSKLWEKRTPPQPLDWFKCLTNTDEIASSDTTQPSGTNETTENSNATKPISHRIWTISECCKMFSSSVSSLYKRLEELEMNKQEKPILVWDKDDEDAMNFVTAASNFRCFIFSIKLKSKFETKSLAGNIIPAIATTNAIVAGLIVLQALKVLNDKISECRTVYLRDKPSQNKLIVASEIVAPNEKCYVCAPKPEIVVKLDLNSFTVKQFETKILKQELNMIQPDVEINDGSARIIISSEEGETTELNDKTLASFGLGNQSSLKCDDFFQNYELRITLMQSNEQTEANGKDYEIIMDAQTFKDVSEKKSDALASPDDKKRTYDKAFDGEEDVSSSTAAAATKKRKSSENEYVVVVAGASAENCAVHSTSGALNEDELGSSSNSINDASDALSDEEEEAVQPKRIRINGNNCLNEREVADMNAKSNSNEVVIIDDDIIIEENSNDLRNEEDFNQQYQVQRVAVHHNGIETTSNGVHITNGMIDQNNQGDSSGSIESNSDVIECSSDEDIIEINSD